MSKLVTIYGGSGFIGRYVARRMAKLGWRVRVAVRRPNEALFVKPYGVPGQVEPVLCNVRNEASIRAAMKGADAVVNCTGTFSQFGKNSYEAVFAKASGVIAQIAAEEGVSNLVHLSALGADPQGATFYATSKAEGEQAVLAAYPNAVILRPSVIFGMEDKFFNKLGCLMMISPVLPMPNAGTKLQPVYVEDVALAAVKGILGEAKPGIYELGGPEVAAMGTLVKRVADVVQRRRLVLPVPSFLARIPALALDVVQLLTGGLIANKLISREQITLLSQDNVVSSGAKSFADLGIAPAAMEPVLPEYLWRFRPSGQYAAIKASANNLKKV